MNQCHEANRSHWNADAQRWKELKDEMGNWHLCHSDPSIMFDDVHLRAFGDLNGKRACVFASGDNRAVFALTGLGATVTSVDISENQLEVARQRASELDPDVLFIRSDVTHIPELESNQFDLVFMGGVAIFWFSNLEAVCREAARILLPGGRAAWLSGIIIPSPLYGRRTSRDLKSSILISTVAQGFSSTDSAQNTTCTIGQSAINSRP